jgi:hypothetical protein
VLQILLSKQTRPRPGEGRGLVCLFL